MLIVGLSGCATAGAPTASAAALESAPPQAACDPVDLRAPSGDRVDLTGVWTVTDGGLYYLHQVKSCLHWFGQSQYGGEPAGNSWSNVFDGTIATDFTVSGRWSDVPFSPNGTMNYGELTLGILFDDSSPDQQVYLSKVHATGGFGGYRWVRRESVPAPVEIVGRFGGSVFPDCPWVESNGVRYELTGDNVVYFERSPISLNVGDHTFHIGDPIRVAGTVIPPFGTGCADSAIVVREVLPGG